MLSLNGLQSANEILSESQCIPPNPAILFNAILATPKDEIQLVLSKTDSNGKTAIHNLIANLIRFNLQNPPLKNIDAIIRMLRSIDIIIGHIDAHDYVKLIGNFTKLKGDKQYSQLSELEQNQEQVLICLKAILETNLHIRTLVNKVQALSAPNLAQILPPIVIMQNEFEAAAVKFFTEHCVAFATTENVKAICFEPLLATIPGDLTDQKNNAMIATGLPTLAMDFSPKYSGQEAIVWHDAASNFDIQTLLINSRARGIANFAALNSLKYDGRMIIYCQPFEAERILKEFYKINKTNARTIVLADSKSITTGVKSALIKYQKKYKSAIAALWELAFLETLDYSHRDELFERILTKGRYELNFIWVGDNTMPISQRDNLVRIKALQPNSIIQVWTISNILNAEMKKYFSDNQIRLAEIEQLLDPVKYPKTYEMVTELQKAKTLWAALADILKFLILTRNLEVSGSAKRCYMEADNHYQENFNLKAEQKEFIHQYMEDGEDGEDYFHQANVDSYYINLETTIGRKIQDNAAKYLERLLADAQINGPLKRIIASDIQLGFSLEPIVIETFGHIPSALCSGLLQSLNLNFKQFSDLKFAYQVYERRSWLSPKAMVPIPRESLQGRKLEDSVQASNALNTYLKQINKTPAYWQTSIQSHKETEGKAPSRSSIKSNKPS